MSTKKAAAKQQLHEMEVLLELARRISTIESLDELLETIVAMTANVSTADQEACRAAGMDDHVGKPVDINELVATIQHVLGLKTKTAPMGPSCEMFLVGGAGFEPATPAV